MEDFYKMFIFNIELIKNIKCLMEEILYRMVYFQYINKIKSCKDDFDKVLNNLFDMVVCEDFKKCYEIKVDVWGIREYLIGDVIIKFSIIYEFMCGDDGVNKV